jgi:hypothetical protein
MFALVELLINKGENNLIDAIYKISEIQGASEELQLFCKSAKCSNVNKFFIGLKR